MTDNTTIKAYEVISNKTQGPLIKSNIGTQKNMNHKVVIYVQTPADQQQHKYFHSLSF